MQKTLAPNRPPDFVMTLEDAANNDSALGGCFYRLPSDKKGRVWTACYWERHNFNNGLITLDDLENIPGYVHNPEKPFGGIRQVYTEVHKDKMVEIWIEEGKKKIDIAYDLRIYDNKDYLFKKVDPIQYLANQSHTL